MMAGRPKKQVDPAHVLALAKAFCTNEEIAAQLGISRSTLERNFDAVLKEGRNASKGSLRAKQFAMAMNGNVNMLIWLGKNYLGQKDKIEESGDKTVRVVYDKPNPSVSASGAETDSDDPGAF